MPTGPAAWYQYQPGVSGHYIIYDSSGNGRHIAGNPANAPVLTENVHEGHPAWYFDGTREPLVYSGAFAVKHAFVLASNEDATFSGYQGLLSGETSGDVLVGADTTTKFYDLGISNVYSNSGTEYLENNQQSPMSGTFRLVEVKNTTGITLDGIQIGQQRADVTRRWQGHFVEMILFTSVLTTAEIRRVRLYFNLKFAAFKYGLPLHFPSADLVSTIGPSRFRQVPQDFDKTTDSWEYEDAVKDFNEVAGDAPYMWEYAYPAVPKAQLPIFDEFWRQARKANPFTFRDREDYVWTNVRVEDYNRNHEAHKRWRSEVSFQLVGYNSVATYDPPVAPEEPAFLIDGGDPLTDGGDYLFDS